MMSKLPYMQAVAFSYQFQLQPNSPIITGRVAGTLSHSSVTRFASSAAGEPSAS